MNRELYDRATYKGVNSTNSRMLLTTLAEVAREQALAALTAALVRPEAIAMADALAEPLARATEAAVEPLAAVDEARKALAREQQSVTARMKAFWDSKRRADPNDRERPPAQDTPEVQELRAALAAAEAVAMPFKQRVDYHAEQIAGLNRAPVPDAAVLAVLAESLCGCHVDAPVNSATMNTVQAPQAARIKTQTGA